LSEEYTESGADCPTIATKCGVVEAVLPPSLLASGSRFKLHTVVDASTEPVLFSLAASFDFDVIAELIPTTLQFQYDHALATPVIWPPVSRSRNPV